MIKQYALEIKKTNINKIPFDTGTNILNYTIYLIINLSSPPN